MNVRAQLTWSQVTLLALSLITVAVGAAPLAGSEWKPLRIGRLEVPPETRAFVQFRSEGRLEGFGGCNRLMAEYQAGDGDLILGPLAVTRTTCAEGVMQREAALVAALEGARSYLRDRTRLVLFDIAGQPTLEMRQTDWD